MKLSLQFELENNKLPLDYRPSILSFIKKSLESTNAECYNNLYNDKATVKGFTFATFLPNAKIENFNFVLSCNKMSIQFSFFDQALFIALYNAFNSYRNKAYKITDNTLTLKNINIPNETKINSNVINIKFISPLVLRQHDRATNKDKYIDYNDSNFQEEFNKSIKALSENLGFENIVNTEVEIIPINPRRTVTRFKSCSINATFGTFILKGDAKLLNNIYKTGVGGRRSEGFGMFKVLNELSDEALNKLLNELSGEVIR